MMYALSGGERIEASPGAEGICPMCEGKVVPKCGSIVSWHWAHKVKDCDTWSEGESDWHIGWKEEFPEECREVIVHGPDHFHRADVSICGRVIEFQKSPIKHEDINRREHFYGGIVGGIFWVLCANGWNFEFTEMNGGSWDKFQWKYPHQHWWFARERIYLDFCGSLNEGDNLFWVKKIYHDLPCRGWGKWVPKKTFLRNFRDFPLGRAKERGEEITPVAMKW